MKKPFSHFKKALSKGLADYFSLPAPGRLPPLPKLDQKGNAIILGAIFMVVATSLMVIGAKLVSQSVRESKHLGRHVAEAENAARAGLVDALGWFRRKGVVRAFSYPPNYNVTDSPSPAGAIYYVDTPFAPITHANPQQSETLDSTIGLVNEFPLDSGNTQTAQFFARYEVRRQDSRYPDPTTSPTPWVTPSPTATPHPDAVRDITAKRVPPLRDGNGLVWLVTSTGYVFNKKDPTKRFNQFPNHVIATAKLSTEFRKMTLDMPATNATTVWGAVYAEATSLVRFPASTDQAYLHGQPPGTANAFAVVGMIDGPPSFVPTPVPNCQYAVTGTGLDSDLIQGLIGGVSCIRYDGGGGANRDVTVSVSTCGTYRIMAEVRRESSSENTWSVQVVGQNDNQGQGASDFNIPSPSDTWMTIGVTDTAGNQRSWTLNPGNYTVRWSGVDANAYLRCFSMEFISFCNTCPAPSGATTLNNVGNPACIGATMITSINESTVFGLTLPELKLISDKWGQAAAPVKTLDLDYTAGEYGLYYYQGDLTYGYTQTTPYQALRAGGILVVDGNLTLNGGDSSSIPDSHFNGVVFVTGNLTIRDGSQISGAVIMGNSGASTVTGNAVTLTGSGGRRGQILLVPGNVTRAAQQVAQYRESVSARKVLLAIPNY